MKQYMKNKSRLGFFLAMCLGLFSCSKFLEENPKDKLPEDDVYNTISEVYLNAVASLYTYVGGYSDSQGLQGTGRGVYDLNTFTSDEAIIPTRGGDWYDGGFWQGLYLHDWGIENDAIQATWEYLYKVVMLSNKSLERIDKFAETHSATELPTYRAEVRAMRAMYYYYLMDLFGRIRNLNEQALQSYFQTQAAQRTAQMTVITEIAQTWLSLGASKDLLKLAQETYDSQSERLKLIQQSYELGASSMLEVQQAMQTVATAKAAAVQASRSVAQYRNALATLVGTKVPAELEPEGLKMDITKPQVSVASNIPSEVLLARPDIASAEAVLRSANANIGVARAAFFPSITLTGSAGSISGELNELFNGGTHTWSFVPNITLPIFTGGANIANLRAAEAYQKKSIADYELAIQTAFQEVADALATEGTVTEELLAQQQLAAATAETLRLSEERYKNGADSYLEVLDSQRSNFTAQQAVISAQLSRAASLVTLYKVLGGGSQLEEPAETTQTADAK